MVIVEINCHTFTFTSKLLLNIPLSLIKNILRQARFIRQPMKKTLLTGSVSVAVMALEVCTILFLHIWCN